MTYVFLMPKIGDMGGAQMYVCNKSMYLKSKGWRAIICYFTSGGLLIKQYNEFDCFHFPELAWGVQYYKTNEVEDIISKFCSSVNCNDDCVVIESCLFHLSFWGELFAQRINAKHILNFLEEDIPSFSQKVASFMEYKLFRWECMNAWDNSLRRLFKKFYKENYSKYEFRTDFFCSNVFSEDSNVQEIDFKPRDADDNILSIGRLDKPYIKELIKQLVIYVSNNSQRNINIIFIGGAPEAKVEESIEKMFSKYSNVNLYLLGYLYPIPSHIVSFANVAVATSNSVLIPYNYGVPTIAIDANDFYAIGLYGINTNQTVFRGDEPKVPISELLEDVLKNRVVGAIKKEITASKTSDQLLDEHFKEQYDFISRSKKDGSYYNVLDLFSPIDKLRGLFTRAFYSLLVKNR